MRRWGWARCLLILLLVVGVEAEMATYSKAALQAAMKPKKKTLNSNVSAMLQAGAYVAKNPGSFAVTEPGNRRKAAEVIAVPAGNRARVAPGARLVPGTRRAEDDAINQATGRPYWDSTAGPRPKKTKKRVTSNLPGLIGR